MGGGSATLADFVALMRRVSERRADTAGPMCTGWSPSKGGCDALCSRLPDSFMSPCQALSPVCEAPAHPTRCLHMSGVIAIHEFHSSSGLEGCMQWHRCMPVRCVCASTCLVTVYMLSAAGFWTPWVYVSTACISTHTHHVTHHCEPPIHTTPPTTVSCQLIPPGVDVGWSRWVHSEQCACVQGHCLSVCEHPLTSHHPHI